MYAKEYIEEYSRQQVKAEMRKSPVAVVFPEGGFKVPVLE
jgi:hypothetical protein